MWELICHHTYKLPGIPVDLSDYDNNGRPEKLNDNDFASTGITPGSGTVSFPRKGSRIRVPNSEAWKPLVGLAVEVNARLTSEVHPMGGDLLTRRTLVAGHGSFSFQISELHWLSAFFQGGSVSVDGSDHSVGGRVHTVPLDQWVNLRLVHDGLSTVKLFIDGQVVAQRTGLQAVVQPVRHLGVSIGNEADRDDRFLHHCEIDDIKIWRIDPHEVGRTFLRRPLDPGTASCWEKLFRRINAALAENPECRERLKSELLTTVNQLRRAIVAVGPGAQQRYAEFCNEYARLWRAGLLDSPEMTYLFTDFCKQFEEWGISISSEGLEGLVKECLGEVLGESGLLDCDPQAVALIQLIANACH